MKIDTVKTIVDCEHEWDIDRCVCKKCGITQELWDEIKVRGNIEILRKLFKLEK